MSQREYWSEAMEKRYKRRRLELWPKLPLKGHFFSKIFFCNFRQFFLLMSQKSFLVAYYLFDQIKAFEKTSFVTSVKFIYSEKATQFEKIFLLENKK